MRIAIYLNKGGVEDVIADGPVDVYIVDCDTDGADKADLCMLDGELEAEVSRMSIMPSVSRWQLGIYWRLLDEIEDALGSKGYDPGALIDAAEYQIGRRGE